MYFLGIKFIASFGDKDRIVELSAPNGAGSENYHIMVDRLYWGGIVRRSGIWKVLLQNDNCDFSYGDIQPLIDLIDG